MILCDAVRGGIEWADGRELVGVASCDGLDDTSCGCDCGWWDRPIKGGGTYEEFEAMVHDARLTVSVLADGTKT